MSMNEKSRRRHFGGQNQRAAPHMGRRCPTHYFPTPDSLTYLLNNCLLNIVIRRLTEPS
jgi:hypothetical protein